MDAFAIATHDIDAVAEEEKDYNDNDVDDDVNPQQRNVQNTTKFYFGIV